MKPIPLRRWFWLICEIISKRYIENGEYKTIYYHYDRQGSVRQLTDKNGKIKGEYEYLPFGKIIGIKGGEAKKNAYTYTGREYDSDSGLYYYRARYMHPYSGRFINRDPVFKLDYNIGGCSINNKCSNSVINYYKPQELHPYVYAQNNPILYNDPKGLWCGSGITDPLVPDKPFGFDFTEACIWHDNCYENSWNKFYCDDQFHDIMDDICKDYYSNSTLCNYTSDVYYEVVDTVGWIPYSGERLEDVGDWIVETVSDITGWIGDLLGLGGDAK